MTPWRSALTIVVATLVLSGCKVESLQDPDELSAPERVVSYGAVWLVPERGADVDPTALWETSVRRHLSFLTSADLEGRRPGTEGGRITAAAAEASFSAAGLIPSAGNFGWTTPVPVRVVTTENVKVSFDPPPGVGDTADAGKKEPVVITEGLTVLHRGAAGQFSLELVPVELSSGQPLARKLGLGRLSDTGAGEGSSGPQSRLRAVFDAAHHRGAAACLLQFPPETDPALLSTARAWSRPEVQSIDLDRDPPAGLALEGFLDAAAYNALQGVAAVPEATVHLDFEATERWFEDNTVVGRVVGRVHPEQVVIVTANWDAGALSESLPDGGGAVAATGPAALLALVERIGLLLGTGRRPDRSIVFAATAGGSLGDLGLKRLADAEIAIPENIVAVIHLGDLDWTAPTLTVAGGTESTLGNAFAELMPSAVLTSGSADDGHAAFELPNVVSVTLTRLGGSGSDDILVPATPLVALAATTRVVFDVLWELANSAEQPEFIRIAAPPTDAGLAVPSPNLGAAGQPDKDL